MKGVGAAAFRQCAGFVRIFDENRDEPLDALMVTGLLAIRVIIIGYCDTVGEWPNFRAVQVHLKLELSSVQVPKSGRN